MYSPTVSVIIKAVLKASRSLKRDFGELENLQVSKKGTANFVSTADKYAESTLREELLRARSNFGWFGEESGEKVGEDPIYNFIVDPLDGTNNFLHGLPHWAISVALEKSGEIIAGVVFDPIKDEMFVAEKGKGAYMNNVRILVSARKNLEEVMLGTSIPTARSKPEDLDIFVKDLCSVAPKVSSINKSGSAALDLCYVAAGRFDAYWANSLSIWDVAAGSLIVLEAGGYVSDLQASKKYLHKDKPTSIMAANPLIFDNVLQILKANR